jgi:hypothetical protein
MRYSMTDARVATRGRSRPKMLIGAVAAAALSIGVLGLSTAEASRAVRGDGVVSYLAIDLASSPPVTPNGVVPDASATIVRNEAGVSINIHTFDLMPGHAYTAWVIETTCELCPDPPPPTRLAGNLVGASGVGNFSGHIAVSPDDPMVPVQEPLEGNFHVVIADHGELDPAEMPGAIMSPIPPISFPGPTLNWPQVVLFDL